MRKCALIYWTAKNPCAPPGASPFRQMSQPTDETDGIRNKQGKSLSLFILHLCAICCVYNNGATMVCDTTDCPQGSRNMGAFPLKFGFANGAGGKYSYFYSKTGKFGSKPKYLK